jgi:hypothetical protein
MDSYLNHLLRGFWQVIERECHRRGYLKRLDRDKAWEFVMSAWSEVVPMLEIDEKNLPYNVPYHSTYLLSSPPLSEASQEELVRLGRSVLYELEKQQGCLCFRECV